MAQHLLEAEREQEREIELGESQGAAGRLAGRKAVVS